MADGGDNTCCPVCLENYTEEGDTVPRILPCSHTLCSGCLTQLKHSSPGSSFTCPIDRKPFPKTEHFPENRYIIGSLTTRHVELKETSDFLKCQEHKSRDLSLHCKECKADICELCMNKDHLGHNVTDIQDHLEETKDEFIAAVASLRGEVEKRKLKTVELKKQVQVINSACLDNLKSTRAAIMRHFDELEAQVMCEIDGTQTEFLTQEKQLQEMAEKSSNLQQKIKEASPAEMMKRKKSLQEMKKNLKELPTRDSFKTFRFSKQPLTDQCLKLITESFKVGQLVTKRHDSSENVRLEGLVLGQDNKVFTIGEAAKDGQFLLSCFNLETNEQIGNAALDSQPVGLAVVQIEKDCCVALSYSEEKSLEFRREDSLNTKVETYSVSPAIPYKICSASPCLLLFHSSSRSLVHWLDCSTKPPRPAQGQKSFKTELPQDMCVMQDRDKTFLGVSWKTPKASGITVYNTNTGAIQWRIMGKMPGMNKALKPMGITADNKGHLFACDPGNGCVQLLSVGTGRHLGAVVRDEEQGVENTRWSRWSEAAQSLIVGHNVQGKWTISAMKMEY